MQAVTHKLKRNMTHPRFTSLRSPMGSIGYCQKLNLGIVVSVVSLDVGEASAAMIDQIYPKLPLCMPARPRRRIYKGVFEIIMCTHFSCDSEDEWHPPPMANHRKDV